MRNVEECLEYIKGYCNKHKKCDEIGAECRLYDKTMKQCFLCGGSLPCDWEIEKEENED